MRSIEDIKKQLFELEGNEYVLLSDKYISCKDPLLFKHNKCGKEFKMRYMNFFGKKIYGLSNRCPYCSHGHSRKTLEEFKRDVLEKAGPDYEVIGTEYLGNKKNIRMLHKPCGLEFDVRPDNFLNGTRCPTCACNSKGEAFINQYFIDHNIEFKKEIWFDSCRGEKWPLPFDFALYKDSKFCCLIEYYGIQHYQPTGTSPFATDDLKIHDQIKQEFCKKYNIPLIIIPYTQYKHLNTYLENLISSTIPMEGNLPQ